MKIKLLLFICLFTTISGFAQNQIEASDKEIFKTIVLSKDQTGMPVIKKWVIPIRYKIYGPAEEYMVKEVDSTFSQLKALTGLDIAKTNDADEVNFYILIGKAADFSEIIPSNTMQYYNQYGGFHYRFNNKAEIYNALDLITAESYGTRQDVRYNIKKGIVRQFGFFTPTESKPGSLFYSQNNGKLKFDKYDSALIRLLYSPAFKPGMNIPQVDEVLSKI